VVLAQQSASIGVELALLKVFFTGLAALTVPHMILVDGFLNYETSAGQATDGIQFFLAVPTSETDIS